MNAVKRLVVGDIHGCFEELQDLIVRAGLSADDEIISVGDMLDRGPRSLAVIEFFRDRPKARAVLGNHERKVLAFYRGTLRSPALAQKITRRQLGEARLAEVCSFIETLPTSIALDEALIVHAFFEPGIPLDSQREEVIVGTRAAGSDLQRRYPRPWYELYDGDRPLIVGHLVYGSTMSSPLVWPPPSEASPRVFGIDTGCVNGGRLTGLLLPDFEMVSVPARDNHWARTRAEHLDLVYNGKDVSTLTWATVDQVRARSDAWVDAAWRAQVMTLLDEVDAATERIRPLVEDLHERALSRLGAADERGTLSRQEQGRTYADALGPTRLCGLLHAYRRVGNLEAAVRRRFRKPAAMLAWVKELGLYP